MTKNKVKIHLTMRDLRVISSVAIFYTSGPRFVIHPKSMSSDDKQSLNSFAKRLMKLRKYFRKNRPEFVNIEAFTEKLWNIHNEIMCSEKNIRLALYAFEESFLEYEDEDYFDMQVFTSRTNEEFFATYHKLKDFYSKIQQRNKEIVHLMIQQQK